LFGQPDGGLGGVRKFALIHTGSGSDQPEKNWLIHLMKTDPEDLPRPEAVEAPPAGSVEEPPHKATGPSRADAVDSGHEPVKGRPTETAGPAQPRSVDAGNSDHKFPEHVEPMLATLTDAEHFGDETDWAFEMKWDGVRTVAYLADGRVELRSRKGRDDTAAYFDVAEDLARLDVETAILDGEVVVLDPAGRPRFGLLQNRINLTRPVDIHRVAASHPAQLMLFDILEFNGRSLLKKTYVERRAVLDDVIRPQPGSRIHVPPIFEGDLTAAMETSKQLQLEGVVAKRRSSTYQPGQRSRSWLKIKLHKTQEVVIGGWRGGQGRREGGVGSLLIGVPSSDGLRYIGRVGSGFNDRQLDEIEALLKPLARKTSPLIDVPRADARDAHWVTPSLVGEVTYGELTEPGRLRHPVWRGLRSDKSPADVRWEAPS
jgi:bifunctional non-homologous end joining protein LigD